MLNQRLFTAAILAPLFLAAIWYLPPIGVAVLIGCIILVGAWELSQMLPYKKPQIQWIYLLSLALTMWIIYPIASTPTLYPLYFITTICWAISTVWLIRRRQPLTEITFSKPIVLIVSSLILLIAWLSILTIHQIAGPAWLLGLLMLIWAIDTGAYFSGRRWGKQCLSPHISPGKTWAGVYGALAAATLCAIVLGLWQSVSVIIIVIFSWLITGLSIGGDLAESMLKRQAGVKDSGHLLPGHGGILDRIDSILATAPAFVCGLGIVNWLA
jgi:phosphatidate cytidylyltransferase